MRFEFEIDKGAMLVSFFGDMDEYGVRQVRDEVDEVLQNAPSLRVVIFDMREVSFIDSTGLGFVLGRYRKLAQRRVELVLRNVPKQVDKVFSASGVYRYVPIVE